jgi:hypothetical protein
MSRIWKYYRDLHRLGDWAVENEMKINPNKSKAISFTRAWMKDPNYSFCFCKYLGIIIRSDLTWVDQVNYMVKKPGGHYIS